MKKKDLIEFLRSTIEGDAIIARIYNLFHLTYKYSLEELEELIQYGVKNNYFTIGDLEDYEKNYSKVEWAEDNVYQEIFMNDKEPYIKCLFSGDGTVPKNFMKFLDI
jgi:hypothetical protein